MIHVKITRAKLNKEERREIVPKEVFALLSTKPCADGQLLPLVGTLPHIKLAQSAYHHFLLSPGHRCN